MCGIAGFLPSRLTDDPPAILDRMAVSLNHRGPDRRNSWLSREVGLAHTRLRIIDLREEADQPMSDVSGRFHLVYNGEIYNYRELRQELGGRRERFRTESDTEVLLETYARHVEDAVHRLNGMFAFAIWDEREKCLFLARDRAGVKPLVYFHDGRFFAFASEIKALLCIPYVKERLRTSPKALALYFTYGFIPAPYTVYEHIFKLEPAHRAHVRSSGDRVELRIERYWSPVPTQTLPPQSTADLRDLFTDAVRIRLHADVPLGALLSGGIDSSLCVAAIAKERPVLTYTVGYEGQPFLDERPIAKDFAARHPNIAYHEILLRPQDILDTMDQTLNHLDEPFGDSSLLPQTAVSRALKEHVTVAISGDGGDEVFGGYDKYKASLLAENPLWRILRILGPFLPLLPEGKGSRLSDRIRQLRRLVSGMGKDRIDRQVDWEIGLDAASLRKILKGPVSEQAGLGRSLYGSLFEHSRMEDVLNRIMAVDYLLSLPNDMLFKVDQASMQFALEVRSPFLDYRLAEYAFAFPGRQKISLRRNKIMLREAFPEVISGPLARQPKRGFQAPVGEWFKGPLRKTLWDTLTDSSLSDTLNLGEVETLLRRHDQGRGYRDHELWILFVYARWEARRRLTGFG